MGKLKRAFDPMKPWERKVKPWVIDLQNPFDMRAAQEMVKNNIIKGVVISSGIVGPFYLEKDVKEAIAVINARACQLRTFDKRKTKAPTLEQFLERHRNKTGS